MKIMILGGSGFIGTYLNKYFLDRNYRVEIVGRHIDVIHNNFLFDHIKERSPDVIINCLTFGGKESVTEKSSQIITDNLIFFSNILRSAKYFKKFINIGSGSELRHQNENINKKIEDELWNVYPDQGSYAISKNIITRICNNIENFYTLRLFGCFGPGEPSFRFFTKYKNSIVSNTPFLLKDSYFDNFYVEDFCRVVEYYLIYKDLPKDINCVYKDKYKLSYQLDLFTKINNWKTNYIIDEIANNYTGCSKNLENLGIDFIGLGAGLKGYK